MPRDSFRDTNEVIKAAETKAVTDIAYHHSGRFGGDAEKPPAYIDPLERKNRELLAQGMQYSAGAKAHPVTSQSNQTNGANPDGQEMQPENLTPEQYDENIERLAENTHDPQLQNVLKNALTHRPGADLQAVLSHEHKPSAPTPSPFAK